MNVFEKILNVLTKNLGYTVVLLVAIALFGIFSDGLLSGLITAASALIIYICVDMLYREYKKLGNKPAAAKEAAKPAAKAAPKATAKPAAKATKPAKSAVKPVAKAAKPAAKKKSSSSKKK